LFEEETMKRAFVLLSATAIMMAAGSLIASAAPANINFGQQASEATSLVDQARVIRRARIVAVRPVVVRRVYASYGYRNYGCWPRYR
jgi:hypothetical protein